MIEQAVLCLALNIYHEARGEPLEGQFAVALVTLNRAQHNKARICREVYRKDQFSWTASHKSAIHDKKAFELAKKVAHRSLTLWDFTRGATHYHADHVNPTWAKKLAYVGRWGHHKFYRG